MQLWKLPDIVIPPDIIFYIGGFPVTNTLLCTWLSIIVLVAFFFFATRKQAIVPSRLQAITELVVEYFLGLVQNVSGKEKGKKFFPLVATLFTFIVVCNLLDVFPGVDTIGSVRNDLLAHAQQLAQSHSAACAPLWGFLATCQPVGGFLLFGPNISNAIVPWIRPATSDLNLTFAMAIVTVITCQVIGFYTLGPREHLSKYINLRALLKLNFQGFIEFFVGLIDIVTETSRILSFAFRLFGNIFAGSAVLAVFAFILPAAANIIFIPLELFVALVQALVFALLTLVFLEMATTSHSGHEGETEHEAEAEVRSNEARETVAAH